MDFIRNTTLIATLGGQPQVVTFTLDALLARGIPITQLVLIHFASNDPRLQRAIQKVVDEFDGHRYKNQPMQLTRVPVDAQAGSLGDIRDEADAHAAWEAINQLIINLKEAHHTLHVCITGGRRMLCLMTMSVAMLHFGHQDALWHMYTPDEWIERSREGARMHLPLGEDTGFRLIQVPMMPWGSYFPVLRQLTRPVTGEHDPMATPRRVLDYGEEARRKAVWQKLTRRQREVLQAFAEGLGPQEVAERLFVSVKTVDSHKTIILAECRNAWSLPEESWLDYRFLVDKFSGSPS